MGFRLVPKSVTLNDHVHVQRNGRYFALFTLNVFDLKANSIKVTETRHTFSRKNVAQRIYLLAIYGSLRHSRKLLRTSALNSNRGTHSSYQKRQSDQYRAITGKQCEIRCQLSTSKSRI